MRAAVLHRTAPIDQAPLSVEDVERPSPGLGEVLIRVRSCGVCRTDLHVVEGELDQSKQKMPVVPGHQVVGEIVAVNNSLPLPEEEDRAEGDRVDALQPGDRVGVAWLHSTCGRCRFCTNGKENLCDAAQFTGWTVDGGYAEYILAPAEFVYPLPQTMNDLEIAPLLCAGIIGYRCLKMCDLDDWRGVKLGIYGFGAAGHIAIQIARHRGAEAYIATRDPRHQGLAEELGAAWVGGTVDAPPAKLDAAIIFAPAGEIVPHTLRALDKGGRLVLGGIHMSPVPGIEYKDLYWERRIQSVANNTRRDGVDFLREAAEARVKTHTEVFPLEEVNDALRALKHDAIRGAAVIRVGH